jgi:hypothetical protein
MAEPAAWAPPQPAKVTPLAGGIETDVRENRFLRFSPMKN